MVDSLNTQGTEQLIGTEAGEGAAPKAGLAGFLSTTLGKLVIGGVVVLVVVGALGVIGFLFLSGGGDGKIDGQPVAIPGAATSTVGASVEASPTERPVESMSDTFAFRNIFKPTVKITLVPLAGESATDSSAAVPDVPADTLFLNRVTTVDGVDKAELVWNSSVYVLAEGESIPDTPWKVLSISGETVVMLFGDSRVTLTVGQGMSTK